MKIKSDIAHSFFIEIISRILLRRREIVYGEWSGNKCICLSFDCDYREDMEACSFVVKLLRDEEIFASFAIPGYLAASFPETIDELINDGHEILNHTFSHPPNFRKMLYGDIRREIRNFQDLMLNTYNYLPRGFRAPHGLRRKTPELFRILKEEQMYDSSLIGYGILDFDGVLEIPLTPCPEHPLLAFDSYHHFRFPFFSSSENKLLKLWKSLLGTTDFINIFLDPIDLNNEIRLNLLKEMIKIAKESGFCFYQMIRVCGDVHRL